MRHEHTWSDYYEENEGREPRQMLVEVLTTFPAPGQAIDLGCGAGIDTVAMLAEGWTVFATDAEGEAIERLRARLPGASDRLTTEIVTMEQVELPSADLLWASFSLFFCHPDAFPSVWDKIRAAIRPRGRFAGQLLGDRDAWAPEGDITAFDRDTAIDLFDGWTIERFEEEEEDGEACSGPKHWHVFHVVAQAPSTRP